MKGVISVMNELMRSKLVVFFLIIAFLSVTGCNQVNTPTDDNNIEVIKDGHTKIMTAFLNSPNFPELKQKAAVYSRLHGVDLNVPIKLSSVAIMDAKSEIKSILETQGYDTTNFDEVADQIIELTMNYDASTCTYVPRSAESISQELEVETELCEPVKTTIDEMGQLADSDLNGDEILQEYETKLIELKADYSRLKTYEPQTEVTIAIGESSLQLATEEEAYYCSPLAVSIPNSTWTSAIKGCMIILADCAGGLFGLAAGPAGSIIAAAIASCLMTLALAAMDSI